MVIHNRFKPKYKSFQRLRENINNTKKIYTFKKKKWAQLLKRLVRSKKYKFFNHDLYHISRNAKLFKNSYRSQLLTKQRLKLFYGKLSDNKLKNLSRKAVVRSKIKFIKNRASEILLLSLETRLDSTLYRSYFVSTISSARQLIIHGNILVNNKKVTQSNLLLVNGDLIQILKSAEITVKKNILKSTFKPLPPTHLEINFKILSIYFIADIKVIHLSNYYSFWLNLKNVLSSYKN